MAYRPPTSEQCADYLRPAVEDQSSYDVSLKDIKDIVEHRLDVFAKQLDAAPSLVGDDVKAIRSEMQSLLEQLPGMEETDAWNQCTFLQLSCDRLLSAYRELQGLVGLFAGYKNAPLTRDTAIHKARVVFMAANNALVLKGGVYEGVVYIGLRGRQTTKQLGEHAPDLGPDVDPAEVRERMHGILRELTDNTVTIAGERLRDIHRELDGLFEAMNPTMGIM